VLQFYSNHRRALISTPSYRFMPTKITCTVITSIFIRYKFTNYGCYNGYLYVINLRIYPDTPYGRMAFGIQIYRGMGFDIDKTTINFRLKERMVIIRYNVIQLSGYIACDCIGYPDTLNS
jgi:hypothetical protein